MCDKSTSAEFSAGCLSSSVHPSSETSAASHQQFRGKSEFLIQSQIPSPPSRPDSRSFRQSLSLTVKQLLGLPLASLPLPPGMKGHELARWRRFAAKGGIGKCTAVNDCVAHSSDDLMFLKVRSRLGVVLVSNGF